MKSSIIRNAILFLAFSINASKVVAQDVDYYFVAHPDDWQLFMSANAHDDVVYYDSKVVFVTLTAGDGGAGDGGEGFIPYYKARENGSLKSAQFLANIQSPGLKLKQTNPTINQHAIKKYVYKNTVCYFLRLPDGNLDGSGFDGPDAFASLEKLRNGTITQLTAVDKSTTYQSWEDLCNTLKAIIIKEKGKDDQVYINIPDTDPEINADDHSDHYNTGFAAEQAVMSLPWVGIAGFVDYGSADSATNLEPSQIEDAAALHASDIIGMTEGGYESNWDDDHKSWLDKQYFRITRPIPGDVKKTASTNSIVTNNLIKSSAYILKAYPNPVNQNAASLNVEVLVRQEGVVKFLLTAAGTGAMFEVYEKNIIGKQLVSIPLKNHLSAGVYVLSIVRDNKIMDRKKIVIE